MNVNDVSEIPKITKCRLEMIFDRQQELHDKYKIIEGKIGLGHGLIQGNQFNIDNKVCQYYMKDMFWRVTEELGESAEALEDHVMEPSYKEAYIHGIEELADSLHFMVEALIVIGITPEEVQTLHYKEKRDRLDMMWVNTMRPFIHRGEMNIKDLSFFYFNVVKELGLAANCLKNKPWKQFQIITDTVRFRQHAICALTSLIELFRYCKVQPQGIYDIYFCKSEVNKFRIRSNY